MLSLRFPKLWSGIGWLLLAGVVLLSLVPGPSLPNLGASDKLEHAVAYFSLMAWFAGFYRQRYYVPIAVVLAALGLSLDLLQGLIPTRSFDWYDVAMNCAGVAAGLVLSFWLLGGWCQRLEQRLLS